jgi:AcrR family transcriptional regulator
VRRRKKPADRRQDLLQAAVACLAEFGPRGATGREVCRRAGVSHGLLQHYFGAQEDLFLETYEALSARYLDSLERTLAAESAPEASLKAVFRELFSQDWGSTHIFGAWIAFWSMIGSDTRFAQVHDTHKRRQEALLAAAFQQRMTGGLTAEERAVLMSAVMDGLWLEYCLSPGALAAERAVDLCCKALERINGGQFK